MGGAVIYILWRTGANQGVAVASQVIDTYKTQVQQLREELATEKENRARDIALEREARDKERHDLKNQIQQLLLRVATMEGANVEKDKKIKEFTEIFQGKSPEEGEYRKYMLSFTERVASWMSQSTEVLMGMKDVLYELSEKAKEKNSTERKERPKKSRQ